MNRHVPLQSIQRPQMHSQLAPRHAIAWIQRIWNYKHTIAVVALVSWILFVSLPRNRQSLPRPETLRSIEEPRPSDPRQQLRASDPNAMVPATGVIDDKQSITPDPHNPFDPTWNEITGGLSFDATWIKVMPAHEVLEGSAPTDTDFPPAMTPAEVAMLRAYLAKAEHYFEFGCGGSTVLAASYSNLKSVHSVDSNFDWVKRIMSSSKVQSASDRITTHYVDINANGNNWGCPWDGSRRRAFPAYSLQIANENSLPFQAPMATEPIPDLVLVDGRFRVACALQAFLATRPSDIILIHDYVKREQYHVVELFLEPVERADTLVAFRKKAGVDPADVLAMYDQYKYNPA